MSLKNQDVKQGKIKSKNTFCATTSNMWHHTFSLQSSHCNYDATVLLWL